MPGRKLRSNFRKKVLYFLQRVGYTSLKLKEPTLWNKNMYKIDRNFADSLIINEGVIAKIFKRHSLVYNQIKYRFSGVSGIFYGVSFQRLVEFLEEEDIQYVLFDGWAEEIVV